MADDSPTSLIDALRTLRSSVPPEAKQPVDEAIAALDPALSPGHAGPEAVELASPADLASRIDHTQLRPDATDADIDRLCEEAKAHGFAAACVHPVHIARIAEALEDTTVAPCTVVGFPHGANTPETKAHEARQAVRHGTQECDMVIALGAMKSRRFSDVKTDIQAVVEAAHDAEPAAHVKVILETARLTDAEIAVACILAQHAGADFVKTSTGFASGGATTHHVALMRQVVGDALGVKASGGIRSVEDARRMLRHGATRLGASGSVHIMDEAATALGAS